MDLAGYRVYRRSTSSTNWRWIATPDSTAYTDTTLVATGASYLYELRSYDKAGNQSTNSAGKTITTADRVAPTTPAGLQASQEPTGIRVTWTTAAGATSYRVYRATNEDGPYSRIRTTTEASYLDTSAAEGILYHYRVDAVDAAGNESARSIAVPGVRRDLVPPSAVTGLTVTPTEYGFALSWDANPTPDLAGYSIRRGQMWEEEGKTAVCDFYGFYEVSADTTTRAHPTLPDGGKACFAVSAFDEESNSASSETVSATELDMTPSVPTPEGSPLTLTVTAAAGSDDNHLSWYGLDPSVPEQAGGYRIYRWNQDTSAYETVAEVTSGVQEFIDAGARRGTTAFYRVTALATDGTQTLPAGDYVITAPVQ